MRLKELRVHGIGPFSSEVKIPFASFGGGIIAFVGRIGSGKSHLLALSGPASIYGEFPEVLGKFTSFTDHVIEGTRDATSELAYEMGGVEYKILRHADPLFGGGRGKQEAYLIENKIGIGGPLIGTFDAAIAKLFPEKALLYSAEYASQGKQGSFFSLEKRERKDLFAAMLGLERIQARAAQAAEKVAEIERKLTIASSLRQILEKNVANLKEYREKEAVLVAELKELDEKYGENANLIAQKEQILGSAQKAATRNKTLYEEWIAQRDRDAGRVAKLNHAISLRELDIRLLKAVAERRLEAQQAADEIESIRTEVDLLREKEAVHMRLFAKISVEHTALVRERQSLVQQYNDLALREEKERAHLGEMKQKAANVCQVCPLGDEVRHAENGLMDIIHGLAKIKAKGQQCRVKLDESAEEVEDMEKRLSTVRAELKIKADRLNELSEIAGVLPQAIAADSKLSAYEVELQQLREELSQLPSQFGENPYKKALDESRTAEEQALEECNNAVRISDGLHWIITDRTASLNQTRGMISNVETAPTELEELERKNNDLLTDLSDWKVLERAFGRDGIQALEIDAAGPAVSAIANELLQACWGRRFTLAIKTTAPTKKGTQKEIFDIEIFDAETGRKGTNWSGGETALFDEAIRLSLAIYNAQHRGGPKIETLWRDETAGALDSDEAKRFVNMLRKAREIGGFHHVLVISHQEDVWRQADVRIYVSRTKGVSVES